MSRVCEITGKRFMVGNKVSHSNRRTLRKFNVNLQTKKFYVPELDTWIWLKVSMDGLRNINRKGIYACLKDAEKKGLIKLY